MALPDNLGETRDDDVSQLIHDLLDREMPVGSDDLPDQNSGILDMNDVCTEGAYPNRSELGVTHHDRIHSSPLEIGELPHRTEVHFRQERAVEAVLPALQRRE